MAYSQDDDENRSPCNHFCLWTYCHGFRHFALTKNALFWVIWIIIMVFNSILAFLSMYGITAKFASGATAEWKTYGLIEGKKSPNPRLYGL